MVEYIIGGVAAIAGFRMARHAFRKHLYPKIKGYLGELSVKHELSKLASEDTVLLHDLLLSTGRDTTQIDHVVVSKYGVFTVETKNFSGLISGKEWDREWQQLTANSAHPIPNPVRQNYKHSLALKKALTEYPNIPIHSIIVFSNKSRLDVTSEKALVINRRDLSAGIQTFCDKPIFSESQVQHIQKVLKSTNITDPVQRRRHKAQVRVRKELFGADELSKAFEEGKNSPILHFAPQASLIDRIVQEKLDDYHARGPVLMICGKTDTIDGFLRNARRNKDGTVAAPGTAFDHIVCPYTGTQFPPSEEPNLERGLWLSYFTKNPELADHITTKEGFTELFPTRSRGSVIAHDYVNAPVSSTILAKNTDWYRNLEQTLRKPSMDAQIKDAVKQEADQSLCADVSRDHGVPYQTR